ncbi:SDR family NAD(P)-dependent oxidoreductase [Hymenobacter cellulosilyticus]|uniref:SDR family NAD(P)-dependent oxidoreductase n=1 Tax=Hymenobacter cellulosilyticus TaxID=2932248 RepID=A0A8T9QFL1_9BACT|nr:SDR family NAD(P)-dependent oxidoreductase [Hymenobacter cellulosilyticus]UOQ75201.1 SDR family NAD(P)-dependent oxidoreductase [Hymenobacter cellulosilyticus]
MGIGLGLAKAFLAQGAAVAVCGRSREALDHFSRTYPAALAIQADVTQAADRTRLLDRVAERFGRLDVLVNNAGRFIERDFTTGTDPVADLEQEVALNLTAPIQLTSEVLVRWPALTALVFVTSGFALVSPTRAPTYGAVKAGLHGFAEGLRRQLAPKGTHVLELLPTTTDTPGTAHETRKKMTTEEVAAVTLKALARRQPMALPGPMKLLPTLLRIAPRATGRMVANI